MYTPRQTRDLAALSASLQLATTRRDYSISDQLDPKHRHPGTLSLAVTVSSGESPSPLALTVSHVKEDVYNVKFADGDETQVELDWQVGSSTVEAAFSKSGLRVVSQVRIFLYYKHFDIYVYSFIN